MDYSNARNGVKKIFISEIIALIASVLAVVFGVAAMTFAENSQFNGTAIASGVGVLIAFGVYVFAYILQIFGILCAGKDESAFKISLYAILGLLLTTILSAVFYKNSFVSYIFEIAQGVAEFFLVHYIIHGIMHICENLGRPDMVKKGKRIFKVIYTALAFEIVVLICEIVFGREVGEEIAAPFGIVANVLKFVETALFLIYIGKGNKILKDNAEQI